MKDALKKFVDQNREALDDKTPRHKVWQAIADQLPQSKVVSLWNSVTLWRAAAIFLTGLSAFLFVKNMDSPVEKKVAKQLQGEFEDVESFYSDEIAKKVALIDDFGGTFEEDQFTQDFEKLDAMYQVLSDQLKDNPSQKVRDALILNMLVRVDLLNRQIKKLEDQKRKQQGDASV